MKQLFSLLLFISLFVNNAISQSSIAESENFLIQEKIGQKFEQLSASEDNIKIIFHKDRIEVMSEEDGIDDFFFIMFENVSLESPKAEGFINSEIIPHNNSDMSEVLGSSEIEKSYYDSILYKDNKSGGIIEIRKVTNGIEFTADDNIPLKLNVQGNSGIINARSQQMQIERFGKIIQFESNSNELIKNNRNIDFKHNGGNDNTGLHLLITLF